MVEQSAVLNVDQAAQILSISRGSCYAAIRANEIPHIRIGKRILIPRAKLFTLLGEDVAAPAPAEA